MSSPIEQPAAPLSRRERRELEREAERREAIARIEAQQATALLAAEKQDEALVAGAVEATAANAIKEAAVEAEVSTAPVFMSRRERREAELAAVAQQQAVAETAARQSLPATVASKAPAPVVAEAAAEPTFMSRRERREAERLAAAAAIARLQADSARAAELAVAQNPELFAESTVDGPKLAVAPVAPIRAELANDEDFLPEAVDTAVIETLDVSHEPVVLAPVVSLDEVRAARAEAVDVVPVAPRGEPEVQIPEAFLSKEQADRARRIKRSNLAASSAGRVSGGMVALSFVAGTVVLGAGSAAGFSMLNSGEAASAPVEAAAVATQSLQVASTATHASSNLRMEEITAVTSIGTAAAANLATGVQLPDSKAYTNDITSNVQWPFPMGVQISSEYGYRDSPTAGASSQHGGVDFTPGLGTPIGSIAEGIVTDVDLAGSSGSGIYVEIEHMIEGQRVTSVYAHMKPDTVTVKEGQAVAVGDEIGQVGSTGVSTGPHLHLEIHVQGKHVDPFYFLTKLNVSGVSTEVPSSDDGKSIALGGDEKLTAEDSRALIDDLFSKIG